LAKSTEPRRFAKESHYIILKKNRKSEIRKSEKTRENTRKSKVYTLKHDFLSKSR